VRDSSDNERVIPSDERHDPKAEEKRILIIDREQFSWLEDSAKALRDAGFEVDVLDRYEYPPSSKPAGHKPGLVILGCASIKHDERELIGLILNDHRHLLVFCISLPWAVMRSIFLTGVDDVADKSYDPSALLEHVKHAFESMGTAPRDSYHAAELAAKQQRKEVKQRNE
jgi:hypothetical protein